MVYKHETLRRRESQIFEGVVFYLHKMTEGRRLELRSKISGPNRRIREIIKEQASIEQVDEETRDTAKWLELQEELDGIMLGTVNPAWLLWGLKRIDGIESDGKPLGVEDWKDFPSALFDEVIDAIKSESELNGAERKNSPSPTISGAPADMSQKSSIVDGVSEGDTGNKEIVIPISQTM
jgi:hypothetical protein